MWPITHPPFVVFWRGGLTTSWTNTRSCDGRLTSVVWTGERRGPRVKGVGSKTAARNTTKTTTEKRGHHDHEACGTEAHQCCDQPSFETE